MKRALVLSGGACKGAFEVGALDYLIQELNYDFHVFLGTSVGALNVGFLGQAANQDELKLYMTKLKDFWLSIRKDSDIYDKSRWGLLRFLWKDALYEPNGLRCILYDKIDRRRLFSDQSRTALVAVVALETGELYYADTRRPGDEEDFIEYILASASMPFFFPPVRIKDKRWYDGGLRDVTPLQNIYDMDPDEIVIITIYPLGEDLSPVYAHENPKGSIKIMERVLEIILGEVGANDLQLIKLLSRSKPGVTIKLISPADLIPGKNGLLFDPQQIRNMFENGYKAAKKMKTINIK